MPLKIKDLHRIHDWLWEVPKSYRSDMRVPARIFASEILLNDILRDRSIQQLINTTTLPGIIQAALAMPDTHEGYGFPIGGVVATVYPDGLISPGGIGYDINCGVRLLLSELNFPEIKPQLANLAAALNHAIPSGVGKGGKLKLSNQELDAVLTKGVKWLVEKGHALQEDLPKIESLGSLKEADPAMLSNHAKERGRGQLGTLGAGNHFIEVDRVAEIFDADSAAAMGLFQDQIVILMHTGSRGLGHQVASDYIRVMLKAMPSAGIHLPDPELAGMPFSSVEGQNYFRAMSAAANFAWANRQLIAEEAREAWSKVLGNAGGKLSLLYDVAHNIAKIEEYAVDGQKRQAIVQRKGATRAFPKQPVLIPGSMGTASYVLEGTEKSLEVSFGSTCHGAGRRMSRHAAQREINIEELKNSLQSQGIEIQAGSLRGLAEEAPQAYKNIDEVVAVVEKAGIARKAARLKPVAIVKG
ncbi:MAG: RtcB family protein [Candidatus Margulisbacteria bacterium]|nr:RtcB family protein [Candidatus Margulisiibacteriota bacterium]